MTPSGALTTLLYFSQTNGAGPSGKLIQGLDGVLYGTAEVGGNIAGGVIYSITTNGVFSLLHSFGDGDNLFHPAGGLVQATDAWLYGITYMGGNDLFPPSAIYPGGFFRIRTDGTSIEWGLFDHSTYLPNSAPVQGQDGVFYTTTGELGAYGYGSFVKLSTPTNFAILASFDGTNAAGAKSGLLHGKDGCFYGASFYGGTWEKGCVFKVTPGGTITVAASFDGANGANPHTELIEASDGNFYGTTWAGGSYDFGTVFNLSSDGTITSVYSFSGGPDGRHPQNAALAQGADNNFYGATDQGGDKGYGTIFRLSVPLTPILTNITHTIDTLTLNWSAVAGQQYQLQYSTNLIQTNWNNLGDPITAISGVVTATSFVQPDLRRLYRVRVLP
jgi:uncharacterized repeat protein (TIGR03803 family)